MELFTALDLNEFNENIFKLMAKDWFLLTAGTEDDFNTMTAGWGGIGILWNKKVCTVYVRPQRHTYSFMEKYNTFTLSFFEEEFRKVLSFCGSNSGKDTDKTAETGITPLPTDNNGISFREARLIIECRKIFFQDLDSSNYLDESIHSHYNGDYHRMYVGEITGCFIKQK